MEVSGFILVFCISKMSACRTQKYVYKHVFLQPDVRTYYECKKNKLQVDVRNLKSVTIKPNTIFPTIDFHVEQPP